MALLDPYPPLGNHLLEAGGAVSTSHQVFADRPSSPKRELAVFGHRLCPRMQKLHRILQPVDPIGAAKPQGVL
jgi:hypothetical protein